MIRKVTLLHKLEQLRNPYRLSLLGLLHLTFTRRRLIRRMICFSAVVLVRMSTEFLIGNLEQLSPWLAIFLSPFCVLVSAKKRPLLLLDLLTPSVVSLILSLQHLSDMCVW